MTIEAAVKEANSRREGRDLKSIVSSFGGGRRERRKQSREERKERRGRKREKRKKSSDFELYRVRRSR